MNNSKIKHLFKIVRPWFIFLGFLSYALGVSIVHYLGKTIQWKNYLSGQGLIIFLQAAGMFLSAYMNALEDRRVQNESIKKDPRELGIKPIYNLEIALACFAAAVAIVIVLISQKNMNVSLAIFLCIAFGLMYFYAMPPIRLLPNGFGEITRGFFVMGVIPAVALLLQMNELHRLLPMYSFPLTMFAIATEMSLSLQDYGKEMFKHPISLMAKIGWEKGVHLHNLMIAGGFLLLGIAVIIGLPWALAWPGLIILPVGVLLIWLMMRIARGAKPQWKLLNLTAYILTGFSTYVFCLALWTR